MKSHLMRCTVCVGVFLALVGCGTEADDREGLDDGGRLAFFGEIGEPAAALGSNRLRDLASASVPVIGAAVRRAQLVPGSQYATALARHYNQLTPEVALKWEVLRPTQATFQFADADALVAFAEANAQSLRGHTLVWEVSLPAWMNDSLGANGVRNAMLTHIATVVGRYSGRIAHWDVVNEALTSGGTYRDNVFSRAMGPGYVAEAFHAAHAADPTARLAYNDFAIEAPGLKQDGAFNMLRDLRNAGVPVHEVGIQLHTSPYDWANRRITVTQLRDTIRRFGTLGLDVFITELDAPINQLSGSEASRFDIQRQVYLAVAAACYAEPACKGVTTWGFTDAYTYHPANAKPLPFSSAYAVKPAADGLADGLLGQPSPAFTQPWSTSCWGLPGALFCEPMESDTFHGLTRVHVGGGETAMLTSGAYRGALAGRMTAPTASVVRRAYVERRVNGVGTTVWTRTHLFVPTTSPNNSTAIAFDEPQAPFYGVSAGLDENGRTFLRVAGNPAIRALGPTFPRGRWVCAELRVRVADSGGEAELFLDGTRAALIQNADTRFPSGYGTFKAGIIWSPAGGAPAETRVDELVVSATRPGCG